MCATLKGVTETCSSTDVVIRAETYGTAAAQALVAAVQQEYVERYGDQDATPVDPAEFSPPRGVFLLAYLGGEPVACGGWRAHGGDAELKRMYVAPEARGRGVARAILCALEESAAAAGFGRVILETGSRQPEAAALYESSGYTPVPGYGYYRDSENCRCYAKRLGRGPSDLV